MGGLKAAGYRLVVLHLSHTEEAEEQDRMIRIARAAAPLGALVAAGGDGVLVIDLQRIPDEGPP